MVEQQWKTTQVVGLFASFGFYSILLFSGGGVVGYSLHSYLSVQQPQKFKQEATLVPQQLPQFPPASIQPSQAQLAPTQPPVQMIDPLTDGKVGQAIMEQVSRLHGVIVPEKGKNISKLDEKKIITVFFDPRCPFCHQLFKALDGKVSVKWVPVPVLKDPSVGIKASFYILNAKQEDVGKAIDTAFSYVGEGNNIHTMQQTQDWLNQVAIPEDKKHWLQDSVSAFVALHKERGVSSFGVPSILIPHVDGSITMLDGYEPGDENKIINDFKKGQK